MKKFILASLCLLVLAACAGPNVAEIDTGAGFWRGLWHGVIAPITFVISLFRDDVAMYEVRNNGAWYDVGFLFGAGAWHGGGGVAATRRRPKRDADEDEA